MVQSMMRAGWTLLALGQVAGWKYLSDWDHMRLPTYSTQHIIEFPSSCHEKCLR